MANIIEIKQLNRSFGEGENCVHILKNISLSIKKGDFIAIMGQSGSGKSTLMNIIGCLDAPTSGSYKIHNNETVELSQNQLYVAKPSVLFSNTITSFPVLLQLKMWPCRQSMQGCPKHSV